MIQAAVFMFVALVMGLGMIRSASEEANPGLGFAGVLVTMLSGGSLLLWALLFAIGVR
mgnify:FL=1